MPFEGLLRAFMEFLVELLMKNGLRLNKVQIRESADTVGVFYIVEDCFMSTTLLYLYFCLNKSN